MSAALQLPKTEMSDAEWQTRCELAALYHVVNHLGWTDLINTHMSARIPDEQNNFLINNYGEMFDEVTASSLVKMDMDGNVLGEGGRFNNAGFTIHSGVYKARPDAMCVMHTHTRAGAGISLLRNGIRPISQDALQVFDDIAYHEYGVPASPEECEALGRTCKHGSLRRAAEPRAADTRPDDPRHVVPDVHHGTCVRTGVDCAHARRVAGGDRGFRNRQGRRKDAQAARHLGVRAGGMARAGSDGGSRRRRLPPLRRARAATERGRKLACPSTH